MTTTEHASPQRLYLLQLSRAEIPLGEGRTLPMVTAAYLVVMSDGSYILIDSGTPADYAPAPGKPPVDEEKNVLEHLAGLGVTPDQIDIVICTHFDVDHAGYHDAFAHAPFIVQRRHYEVAQDGARYAPVRSHWNAPGLRYHLVDGVVELVPGLTLVESSGHAPGHQSVLVRLPKSGPVLLAIDAAPLQQLFVPARPAWPTDDNAEEVRASTSKLLDLAAQEEVSLVVFGHDGRQWQNLVRAPDYYA